MFEETITVCKIGYSIEFLELIIPYRCNILLCSLMRGEGDLSMYFLEPMYLVA